MTKRKASAGNSDGVLYKINTTNTMVDAPSKTYHQASLHQWLQPVKAATFASSSLRSQCGPAVPAMSFPQPQTASTVMPAPSLLQPGNAPTPTTAESSGRPSHITSIVLALRSPLKELSQPVSFSPSTRPLTITSEQRGFDALSRGPASYETFTVSQEPTSGKPSFANSSQGAQISSGTAPRENASLKRSLDAFLSLSTPTVIPVESPPSRNRYKTFSDETPMFHLRHLGLRAVITIGRYSSTQDQESVNGLYARNQEIYQFVQDNVHAHFHAVEPDSPMCPLKCVAEHFSVVINGLSSNTDMSSTGQKHVRVLRDSLRMLDAEQDANSNVVVLAFCNFDGFCTNLAAWKRILGLCINIQLLLVVLKPKGVWSMHTDDDVLLAISEHESGVSTSNTHHELIAGWLDVAKSKGIIAEGSRDLLRIMPERRNTFDIDETKEDYRVIPKKRDALLGQLGQPQSLVTYNVSAIDGKYLCFVETCENGVMYFDNFLQHLTEHCEQAGRCILCPIDMSTSKHNYKDHVRRHIFTNDKIEAEPDDRIKGKRGKSKTPRFQQYEIPNANGKSYCVLAQCNIGFATFNELVSHVVAHCVRANKCVLCPEAKATPKTSYQDHVSRHLPLALECPRDGCDRTFAHKSNLRTHLLAHDGMLPLQAQTKLFKCTFPGCTFETPQAHRLEKHLPVHEDTRPRYPCPRGCGKMLLDIKISDHIKRGDCHVARAQGI